MATLRLAQGNAERAIQHAREAVRVMAESAWYGESIVAIRRFLLAQCDLAAGRPAAARRILSECQAVASPGHHVIYQINIDLLDALCAYRQCRKAFSVVLGAAPEAATTRLARMAYPEPAALDQPGGRAANRNAATPPDEKDDGGVPVETGR
jgi:ATP/maltotriose-dependent transcriptional regulator MalT